ncbi:hypothetical protein MXB_884 [Myxobolus squamalis]|nr:hypothetical protein MXB_884 [Myxobolus squamalis]
MSVPTKNIKGNESNLENLKCEITDDSHKIDLTVLLARLNTDIQNGISDAHAAEVLRINGHNCLTPPKKTPEIVKFLKALFTGFSLLLVVGAVLCFIAYTISYVDSPAASQDNLWLGVVLLFVVIVTGVFGYYQEAKSSRIMESFKKLVPQKTLVIRNGRRDTMSARDVVAGDIVLLRGGDLIPADVRIIEAKSFKVDNSSLTGESEPQRRLPECTSDTYLETANIAFAYTFCVEGTCTGVIVATGDKTAMGRIAILTSQLKSRKTPIGIEIEKFIKVITVIAIIIGTIFFIVMLILGEGFLDAVIFLIGIIVANVPEGLLVTVTAALTLTAKIMAKKCCLIKNLESVETLGSTSVICSDKTGTLTQNRMTVSHIWIDNQIETINTGENTLRAKFEGGSPASKMTFNVAALCNRAEFITTQDFNEPVLRWETAGDASESALIKYVELFHGPIIDFRNLYPTMFEIPFNSINKYQLSVHSQPDDPRYLVLMKGAPERIVERCTSILRGDKEENFDAKSKDSFDKAYEEMGGMGERVLGSCYCYLSVDKFPSGCPLSENDEPLFSMNDFVFVGLISMIDPPRAAVPHAVELCRSAGIRVIMVTGDHPITGKAIAKNVGIITGNSETYLEFKQRISGLGEQHAMSETHIAAVISGADLKDMEDIDLDLVIKFHREIVFARTSPQQKLIIVEAFQRSGCVVAVTGDGVNDSPALRKADIGVAMGIAGSDVAKQAADMILMDDNFASIVTGVQQGRIIFDNLKKSIAYTLTSNIPEIFPFMVHILCGIPPPLSTVTILCIDLGTDLIPAISLAYEKAEVDIMKRKPRDPKSDSLVNMILINYAYLLVGVFQTAAAFIVYLYIMMDNGFTWNTLTVSKQWNDPNVFILDDFGQEWPFAARKDLEFTCHTAYFFTIVIVQISDLIISKTRKMSVFKQGILGNPFLLFGIFFEVILALCITYVPALNFILQTRSFHPKYLIPAIFYSLLLWIVDEFRKLSIRRSPGGFIQRETYY